MSFEEEGEEGEGVPVSDFCRHCEQIETAAFREELDALNRREDHFDDELYVELFTAAQRLGCRQGELEATLDFALLFPQSGLPAREELLALRAEVRRADTAERLSALEAQLQPLISAVEALGGDDALSAASAEED